MKISFEISGGFASFPALSRPVLIDTATLDAQAAGRLETLLKNAGFFSLPAQAAALPPGAADYRSYTLTAEDGPRVHTARFTDPIGDPALAQLVSSLEAMPRS